MVLFLILYNNPSKENKEMKGERPTGISKRWEKVALSFLGEKTGKHCHWCKYMVSEDGDVTCGNKASQFCDGDRIRSWDGLECARKCGVFGLNEWYKSDENYRKTFKTEKA